MLQVGWAEVASISTTRSVLVRSGCRASTISRSVPLQEVNPMVAASKELSASKEAVVWARSRASSVASSLTASITCTSARP